jgi:hypothetical protein
MLKKIFKMFEIINISFKMPRSSNYPLSPFQLYRNNTFWYMYIMIHEVGERWPVHLKDADSLTLNNCFLVHGSAEKLCFVPKLY